MEIRIFLHISNIIAKDMKKFHYLLIFHFSFQAISALTTRFFYFSDEFKYLAVGAIDFGTSYSGYAYSFCTSRTEIQRCRWNAGSRGLMSEKTPTCILFDADQNFLAFGFHAEDKFAEFCNKKKENECYFFRSYKMSLYDQMVGIKFLDIDI